ncbi:MAG: DUF559 domain-containing protein, partial [Sphingomonadaceae bacterium]|nr:DUF559 domain-containing protein [Sphingomonadaceae bacterium]
QTVAADEHRTAWLAEHGYRVVRIANAAVADAFDLRLALIQRAGLG